MKRTSSNWFGENRKLPADERRMIQPVMNTSRSFAPNVVLFPAYRAGNASRLWRNGTRYCTEWLSRRNQHILIWRRDVLNETDNASCLWIKVVPRVYEPSSFWMEGSFCHVVGNYASYYMTTLPGDAHCAHKEKWPLKRPRFGARVWQARLFV